MRSENFESVASVFSLLTNFGYGFLIDLIGEYDLSVNVYGCGAEGC
jgi:hypothetical protein